MEKNIAAIKKQFAVADRQLQQATTDMKSLRALVVDFERIKNNLRKLESFYFDEPYREGLEILEKTGADGEFWSTGQDAIWDVSVQYRSLVVELLKKISDDLYDNSTKIAE